MSLVQLKKKKVNKITKGTFVVLLDVFDRFYLVQLRNNLISKEMSSWRYQSFNFLWKKIWRNVDLKSKKSIF